MARLLKRFCGNRAGNTALEYALLAATVSVMVIVGMEGMGIRISGTLARALSLSGAVAP